MKKEEIILKFSKDIFDEYNRKNAVTISNISTTLIEAAASSAFVNESCKSTEEISKSQIIYRKLNSSISEIEFAFRENAKKFLCLLKIFSRNRKFILSYDETEEAFYGEFNKAENNLYLHDLVYETKGAKYGYKYFTVAITCNRGIIYIMQQLKVHYMIFWKKSGSWYKEPLGKLKNGEFCELTKKYKYCRDKSGYWVYSKFVIVKQLEYEGVVNDWIFATDLNKKSSEKYVKRYKKRWGIETIFRVTDDIRIYTTSTNPLVRYFLFMFTCFVYNVWKFFQSFLGENFTLANFCVCINKFMIENQLINPRDYKDFLEVFKKYNSLAKLIR